MSMDEFNRVMFVINFNHIHEDDYFDHLSDGEGNDDGVDEDTDFTPGDSLGNALALVKQIRMSPQARTFFRSSCSQVRIKPLELLLWICTRWASLYKFLDRILMLWKGIDQFVLLADASEKVPNLMNNQLYVDFQLSKKDWDRLGVIHEVLWEPANVQQTFSKELTPTVWCIIPTLEFLIRRWESMAKQPRFHDVKDAITHGVQNMKKWYRKVDNTSSAYFICLDPNIKDLYCCHCWEPDQYAAGMTKLEEVFNEYYVPPQRGQNANMLL
ncbi:hypothetical protein BJV77DRAFT_1074894 [Russula vinacea]|nr:hypothetical protein BJV77DRAFT_1074894 [Russula vinacea]